ncbi:MAG: polyprenol monophosphomannose synthase [Candidatus Cloacimonetes bacterium]|jgi:dolichol-phosphate mannosyltransferase|nr:polyprenol monophosphomannose synthase [Candidatus Cloacimonadota bacterium]MDD4157259.1 polyprenol monophosphomannose synthase [Candidatus Cloacimonadota bacterium]
MRWLVIIPTYNEKDNIAEIINEVLSQDDILDILIVDDNSPDKTYEIVEKLQSSNTKIKLIKRSGKLGLGSAYVEGFKYALRNSYEGIIQMDADFSHDPTTIPIMLKEINNYDLIIGSRYISGINVVNWPLRRLLLSYFAALYVRVITGMPIKDPTGGFKCIKSSVLTKLKLDNIMSDGYSFQIEINYRAWLRKFKIKELSITFTDRRSGQSKMSKKIVHEAITMVWKLKLHSLLKKL